MAATAIGDFTLDRWRLFTEKFDYQRDGCWEWTGGTQSRGYGQFWTGRAKMLAHRVSWEWSTGKRIPDGLVIDHLCRNKRCVNPNHLEPVTDYENRMVRGVWSDTTQDECHRGHPLSGENLYVSPKGRRNCRACQDMRSLAYSMRRQAGDLGCSECDRSFKTKRAVSIHVARSHA